MVPGFYAPGQLCKCVGNPKRALDIFRHRGFHSWVGMVLETVSLITLPNACGVLGSDVGILERLYRLGSALVLHVIMCGLVREWYHMFTHKDGQDDPDYFITDKEIRSKSSGLNALGGLMANYKMHDCIKWQHRSETEISFELAARIRSRHDQSCCNVGRLIYFSIPMFFVSGLMIFSAVYHFGVQSLFPILIALTTAGTLTGPARMFPTGANGHTRKVCGKVWPIGAFYLPCFHCNKEEEDGRSRPRHSFWKVLPAVLIFNLHWALIWILLRTKLLCNFLPVDDAAAFRDFVDGGEIWESGLSIYQASANATFPAPWTVIVVHGLFLLYFGWYMDRREMNIYGGRHVDPDHCSGHSVVKQESLRDWKVDLNKDVANAIIKERLRDYRYMDGQSPEIAKKATGKEGNPIDNTKLIALIRDYRVKEPSYLAAMKARGVADVEKFVTEAEKMPTTNGAEDLVMEQRRELMKLLPYTEGRRFVHVTMGKMHSRALWCGIVDVSIMVGIGVCFAMLLGAALSGFADGNVCKMGTLPLIGPDPTTELQLSQEFSDLALDGRACTELQRLAESARDENCESRWFSWVLPGPLTRIICSALFPWDALIYEKILMQTLKADVEGWVRPSSNIIHVPENLGQNLGQNLGEKMIFEFGGFMDGRCFQSPHLNDYSGPLI